MMSVKDLQANAWIKVSQMAHSLGWVDDWTPETSWIDHILQKMAWCHMQDQLRQREMTERQEALKG
jgi:hypothetical protein